MTAFWQDPCTTTPAIGWGVCWDTDWALINAGQGSGDWFVDGNVDTGHNDLYTAVLMCIFTDARAPLDVDLPGDIDDRRGYHGDFYDVNTDNGETELGSLLWLFERSALTDDAIKGMEDAVYDCLQTLVDQGVIADRVVVLDVDKIKGIVCIQVSLFAENRQRVFEARFTRLWADIFPGLAVRTGS